MLKVKGRDIYISPLTCRETRTAAVYNAKWLTYQH